MPHYHVVLVKRSEELSIEAATEADAVAKAMNYAYLPKREKHWTLEEIHEHAWNHPALCDDDPTVLRLEAEMALESTTK